MNFIKNIIFFTLGKVDFDKDEPITGLQDVFNLARRSYKFVDQLLELFETNEVEHDIYPVVYLGNIGNRIEFKLPIVNAQQAVMIKIRFPFLDLYAKSQEINNKVLEDNANLLG